MKNFFWIVGVFIGSFATAFSQITPGYSITKHESEPNQRHSLQSSLTDKRGTSTYFIENKGQWHDDVLYLCRMGGLDAWITKYGVNYTFYKLDEATPSTREEQRLPDNFQHKDYRVIGHRVLMKLQQQNPAPACEGLHKQKGYYNYFIGNDPPNTPAMWACTKKP